MRSFTAKNTNAVISLSLAPMSAPPIPFSLRRSIDEGCHRRKHPWFGQGKHLGGSFVFSSDNSDLTPFLHLSSALEGHEELRDMIVYDTERLKDCAWSIQFD
jgi:hypothetical protein